MDKIGESLCHRIGKLSNIIRRQFFDNPMKNTEFVTPLHGCIIGYIYENDNREVLQRELESELKLRRSTITTILQAMEKNGLIERASIKTDMRAKQIILTPKSRKIYEDIFKRFKEADKKLIEGISKEELEVFINIVNKMNKNLEE